MLLELAVHVLDALGLVAFHRRDSDTSDARASYDGPVSGETDISLQERYAAQTICFGCGPANPDGLHIRSFPDPAAVGEVVADWQPAPQHQAFPGVLNGGIAGTLMDCHSNWTAAYHLMQARGASTPPTTVTADYHIRMLKPTPTDGPVHLRAYVVDSTDNSATVECELSVDGVVTATCRGTFVAVKPGHPAYERW
jgi:acyl-coenzyme A thioesterase PaaI-like protein